MYIKEHLPWIILFLMFNASIVVIGLIDSSIPDLSVMYVIMINTLMLVIFIIWDYMRQRNFYSDIKNLNVPDDIDGHHYADTALQREVHQSLHRLKQSHEELILTESKKTRENLDELTRFVHDMKMPLTTMHLMIQDVEPMQREKLLAEMSRLEEMLNEILYVKRLPNIKNDLYFEDVSLEILLNHSIKKLRHICMSKGIGFDVVTDVETVESDVKWLQFIIDQLLSNSVKYSENSTIEISTYHDSGYDYIKIRDHGRGIKPEDIKRIFDSGFTSTSDHDDSHSTGMGLYLTKNVADVLNINVVVASVYGEGTTVTLTFSKQNIFNQITSM